MGLDMRRWAGEKTLKAEDLKNKSRRVQIAVVRPAPEPSEKIKFPRPSLILETGEVVMLNPTSVFNLCVEFGDDSDRWIGQFIELHPKSGLVDNVSREWIEIEAIAPTTSTQKRKIDPESGGDRDDMNDSIPF